MPIDYGTNDVTTSGNFVAASGNFTTTLTVNNLPVATGTSISITNAADNRVLTSSNTSGGINAESNLTFNGSTLTVVGLANIDNLRLDGNTLSSTNSNGNIIIAPNGTGPVQFSSSGNSRGLYAVDLQRLQTTSQVASGNYSTIGGGRNNTASGYVSTIGGGQANAATASTSTVAGGSSNTNSGVYSFIGGGRSNSVSGSRSVICGGRSNTCSAQYAFIGGGFNNAVYAYGSSILGGVGNTSNGQYETNVGGIGCTTSNGYSTVSGGGFNNATGYASLVSGGRGSTASAQYSSVLGGFFNTSSGAFSSSSGRHAVASLYGEQARSSGKFNDLGDAQVRKLIARGKTTSGDSTIDLVLDGDLVSPFNTIKIPANSSWFYNVRVVARNEDQVESAAYKFEGLIERSSLATVILGDTSTIVHEDNSGWSCVVSVEDDFYTMQPILNIRCTSNGTVYWLAYVELVQVVVPSPVPAYS